MADEQLQLVSPPFINIRRIKNGALSLAAECAHSNEYRFTVVDGEVWICAGRERAIRLPQRFGVPLDWSALVNLAYKVLTEAPCHHV